MDYDKLESEILEPGYDEYIQKAKYETGVNDHKLHLIWGMADLIRDECTYYDLNQQLERYYQLIEQLKPSREIMRAMDKFYFHDREEFTSTIYWRDEYDYPIYGDYIKELEGNVNFMGFMAFTVCAPTRHRRYRST